MVMPNNLLLITCALFCLAPASVSAQQPDPSDVLGAASAAQPIEEITVVGQESLSVLQFRIKEAEQEMFSYFNENNSSDRMDIICSQRRSTGSNLLNRVCEPKFLTDLRVEKTRNARMGIGVDFNERELVQLAAQDFEKLQNEMLSLRTTNKAFADSLDALADLTTNYEARMKAAPNEK